MLALNGADHDRLFRPSFGHDRLALRIYFEQLVGFEAFGKAFLSLS
jgi:hypothetical protein